MFWTLEAENSIYSFDFSQADKSDKLYLKYIKVLKHFFCESDLLKELNYDASHPANHFYKDNLRKYACYIEYNEGQAMNFMKFEEKFITRKECIDIDVVFNYFVEVRNKPENLNYNVIKGFHLFLMLFLNKYGLDYHYTDHEKFKGLINGKYNDLKIKKDLLIFLKKNKLKKEVKWINKELKTYTNSILFVKQKNYNRFLFHASK